MDSTLEGPWWDTLGKVREPFWRTWAHGKSSDGKEKADVSKLRRIGHVASGKEGVKPSGPIGSSILSHDTLGA